MVSQLLSLSITMLVASLAPFVASFVPGRAVPEVVFLVFAGASLAPMAPTSSGRAGAPSRLSPSWAWPFSS